RSDTLLVRAGSPQHRPPVPEGFEGEVLPHLRDEVVLAIFSRPPDEAKVSLIIEFMPQFGQCPLPRRLVQRLGIEHQPVHIETNRIDSHASGSCGHWSPPSISAQIEGQAMYEILYNT